MIAGLDRPRRQRLSEAWPNPQMYLVLINLETVVGFSVVFPKRSSKICPSKTENSSAACVRLNFFYALRQETACSCRTGCVGVDAIFRIFIFHSERLKIQEAAANGDRCFS